MSMLQGAVLFIVAFGLGVIAAWLFLRQTQHGKASAAALKQQLDQYRQEVEDHLVQTAVLLDELTGKYKDIHDHLGQTAHTLLSEEQRQRVLQQRQGRGYKILVLEDDALTGDETERVPDGRETSQETSARDELNNTVETRQNKME